MDLLHVPVEDDWISLEGVKLEWPVPIRREEDCEVTTTVPFVCEVEVTEKTTVPLLSCDVGAVTGTDVTDAVVPDDLGEVDVADQIVVTFD